jgi:hypothetical protein
VGPEDERPELQRKRSLRRAEADSTIVESTHTCTAREWF